MFSEEQLIEQLGKCRNHPSSSSMVAQKICFRNYLRINILKKGELVDATGASLCDPLISFIRNVAGKLMHNLLFGVNRLTDNRFLNIARGTTGPGY